MGPLPSQSYNVRGPTVPRLKFRKNLNSSHQYNRKHMGKGVENIHADI